jgi:hypothetical protein
VGVEDAAWLQGGGVLILVHTPDVDVALVVAGCEKGAVGSYADRWNGNFVFRNELVGTFVVAQVPNHNHPTAVAGDKFALVRMNDDVVYRVVMSVASLYETRTGVPDPDCAVFRRGTHPLSLTMEGHSCDIAVVALESHYRIRVG